MRVTHSQTQNDESDRDNLNKLPHDILSSLSIAALWLRLYIRHRQIVRVDLIQKSLVIWIEENMLAARCWSIDHQIHFGSTVRI